MSVVSFVPGVSSAGLLRTEISAVPLKQTLVTGVIFPGDCKRVVKNSKRRSIKRENPVCKNVSGVFRRGGQRHAENNTLRAGFATGLKETYK